MLPKTYRWCNGFCGADFVIYWTVKHELTNNAMSARTVDYNATATASIVHSDQALHTVCRSKVNIHAAHHHSQSQAARLLGIDNVQELLQHDSPADQPILNPRPQGLGLGAKFLPHNKVVFGNWHTIGTQHYAHHTGSRVGGWRAQQPGQAGEGVGHADSDRQAPARGGRGGARGACGGV